MGQQKRGLLQMLQEKENREQDGGLLEFLEQEGSGKKKGKQRKSLEDVLNAMEQNGSGKKRKSRQRGSGKRKSASKNGGILSGLFGNEQKQKGGGVPRSELGEMTETKQLDNGAVMGKFEYPEGKKGYVWQIIQGASPEYMQQLQQIRKQPLSQAQAQERFNKYYSPQGTLARKLKNKYPDLSPKQRSSRRKRARGVDKARAVSPQKRVTTRMYQPGAHDYPGVDLGNVQAPTSQSNKGTRKITSRARKLSDIYDIVEEEGVGALSPDERELYEQNQANLQKAQRARRGSSRKGKSVARAKRQARR